MLASACLGVAAAIASGVAPGASGAKRPPIIDVHLYNNAARFLRLDR